MYEVTVRASDGRYYGTLDVVVTVEAVDEAPEFQRNTQDSFVYPENGSSAIYTYRATDPEGSDVTWGLSGTDRGAFSIDKTGVLTFNSPPDYEDPADTDHNNVYELTVEASDGFLEQPNNTPLEVTVTVTNLTDARAVIRGTAQVGRTLTAETSGIPDKDRRDKVDFSYQWLGDDTDVEGATDQTYEITERDEGKTIKVRVKFTGNAGEEETLTSAATAPVKPAQSNEPAAGLPTINGTAQVGETLTADASGISDADGMTNAVFRYQWTRWDGDTDEDIEGATGSTYEVSGEDEGKTIRLRVGFSDDRGNDEALISAATGAVAARPAQLTATFPASQFQSSRHQGEDDRPQVIVAFNLPVQSFDKTTPSVSLTGATVSSLVRHEEDRLENAWVFFLDPEGNDDIVFTLVAGQPCDVGGICTGEGKMLSEGGTATLPGPDEEDKPDNTGSNEPNSPATGEPTISGTAQVGETLTANTSGAADADGLEDVSFTYQWLADDADIAGATNATYTLLATDESKAIRVRVSFTDDAGNDETLTSPATDAVAAEPLEPPAKPTGLTGTASHDSVTLTWDDPQDESITGYAILRRIPGVDPDGQFRELVADTGTTATTYTDDAVKSEARYTYRIKAINGAGTSERSRWFHIDTPASPAPEPANTPATGAPTISGTTQVGGTLTVDTSGIADADGLSDVQYEHQWLADDADIAGATGSTYTLADIDEGKAIKVEVSFTDDAGNSEALTSAATDAVAAAPQTNTPATGAPAISGTAQVGETLTANTSGISDADGLGNAQYEYQWLADDADIAGATGLTYTLADTDEDKAIKVQVSFTDDAGNEETLTSRATAAVVVRPNSPATGEPTISGTAQVGETLTADTPGIADADGLGNVQYEYLWLANDSDISGATSATYTLAAADEGKAIKVRVSFTDDAGNEETVTSAATDAVAAAPQTNTPATGAPTISGTAQVGETLTANTSGISDADGLGNAQYEYQWLADDADIAGATGLTYTLTDSEESKAIKVQVSFTDDADNEETLTSGATDAVVVRPNSPATGEPTISGTAQVGETLEADTSGIADADGLGNVQYEYQWLLDDSAISGATNSTYTLVAADEGKAITVQVTFTDDAGNGETLTSAATDAVEAAPTPNSPATGAPTISGIAQVGETLTADTSGIADANGLSNVQYEYKWLADDAEISGATGSTYTLADADEGKAISLRVSFTDDADNEETLTSAATDVVAGAQPAKPPAKPTGLEATATHDSVTLTWDNPDDDSITGYVILRRIPGVDPQGQFDELAATTGTAATTYTDDTVASSTRYTYRIKAINGAGTSERSRWVHIDTPAAPVPDKPTGLEATASHNSVTLTWDDPGDDSITGYVILRRVRVNDTGGDFDVLVADTASAATTYTDDTVAGGLTYTYRIKAINEHGTSERSRWCHIDTPAAP